MVKLGITRQADLARAAGVGLRTVQGFLNEEHWPRDTTLDSIERLGLNWPTGYLTEVAALHDAALTEQGVTDIGSLTEATREKILADLSRLLRLETSQVVKKDLRSS